MKGGKTFILFSIMAFLLISPALADVTDNIYLGDEALKTGKYDTAIAYYQAASEAYPEYTLPYILIANIYYVKGDYDNSLANAEHALLIDSEDKGALLAKARALNGLKKYETSLMYFENLLKDDTNNPQLILGKTRVLLNLYGPQEAMQYIIGSSEFSADLQTAEYYDLLGDLYSALEEPDPAKSNYQKALGIDPVFSNTQDKYNYLISQEQITAQQSAELSAAALQWYESGKTQVKNKQYSDALESFNTAYNFNPSLFDFIVPYMAYIYIKQKDYSNAIKFSQYMILQDDSNAEAWNYLGISYENTGRFDEAKDAYEKAISLDPSDTTAKLNLQLMFLKNHLFSPGVVISLILLFALIFTFCWRYVLKRIIEFPVFGVLGLIIGSIIGAFFAYSYGEYSPFMRYLNILIGCSVIGLYGGYLWRICQKDDQKIKDFKLLKWNLILSCLMIAGGFYAGFINIYYVDNHYFGAFNGIFIGMITVYLCIDIIILRPLVRQLNGIDKVSEKENPLFPLKQRYENSFYFYIFGLGCFYFLTVYNKSPDTESLYILNNVFLIISSIGMLLIVGLLDTLDTTIQRIGHMIILYIICLPFGFVIYGIYSTIGTIGETISEMALFIIPLAGLLFHYIFSKLDNKKSQKLNKIKLSLDEEEKKKEMILEKISNITGNNNHQVHGEDK